MPHVGSEAFLAPVRLAVLEFVDPERAVHLGDEIGADVVPAVADVVEQRQVERHAAAFLLRDRPCDTWCGAAHARASGSLG